MATEVQEIKYQPIQSLYTKSLGLTKQLYKRAGIQNIYIEKGAELLNKYSQPLVEICSDMIDTKVDGVIKVIKPYKDQFDQKRQDLLVYIPEHIPLQQFTNYSMQWIQQNMPFKQGFVVQWEQFREKFQNIDNKAQEQLKLFYDKASELWLKMKEPNYTEVKKIILEATAASMTSAINLSENAQTQFIHALTDVGSKALNLKNKVTEKLFIEDIQKNLGGLYQDNLKPHILQYYTYLTELRQEYQNKKQEEINRIKRYAQAAKDVSLEKCETVIDLLNKKTFTYKKKYYLNDLDELESIQDEDNLIRLKKKVNWLAISSYEILKGAAQQNETLQQLDKQYHIYQKATLALDLARAYTDKLNNNILQPTIQWISVTKQTTANHFKVSINFLEPLEILSDIEFLKYGTSILAQYPVYILNTKIVILFDKNRLKEYTEVIQQEVTKFVEGVVYYVKTKEVKNDSWNLYHNITNRINQINHKYQLQLQDEESHSQTHQQQPENQYQIQQNDEPQQQHNEVQPEPVEQNNQNNQDSGDNQEIVEVKQNEEHQEQIDNNQEEHRNQ